jgi:hypothetical protein
MIIIYNCTKKESFVSNNKKIIDEIGGRQIKEDVTNNIMNKMTEQASSCSAQMAAKQKMKTKVGDIMGLKVLKIGGGQQEQQVSLQLSCIDVSSKLENNMANIIANIVSQYLVKKFDDTSMLKLENNLKNQMSIGKFPLGSTTVDTNVTQNYNFNISVKMPFTIKNIIVNEINKNFSTKTLKERVANL